MESTEFERPVRFDHEDLDPTRMMIRTGTHGLQPGAQIEVEVGARWRVLGGLRERIGGQWLPCIVVSDNTHEIVVRLLERSY